MTRIPLLSPKLFRLVLLLLGFAVPLGFSQEEAPSDTEAGEIQPKRSFDLEAWKQQQVDRINQQVLDFLDKMDTMPAGDTERRQEFANTLGKFYVDELKLNMQTRKLRNQAGGGQRRGDGQRGGGGGPQGRNPELRAQMMELRGQREAIRTDLTKSVRKLLDKQEFKQYRKVSKEMIPELPQMRGPGGGGGRGGGGGGRGGGGGGGF